MWGRPSFGGRSKNSAFGFEAAVVRVRGPRDQCANADVHARLWVDHRDRGLRGRGLAAARYAGAQQCPNLDVIKRERVSDDPQVLGCAESVIRVLPHWNDWAHVNCLAK